MKNMSKANESMQAAPPGVRLATITEAEATVSKKGTSMIHTVVQISDGSEFEGQLADDYILTDGSAKGGGIGKAKLRGLGTPSVLAVLDSDAEVSDEQICAEILGQQFFVTFGNEARMGKATPESTDYTVPLVYVDPETGKSGPLNKLTVKGYSRHAPGAARPAAAPQAQAQAPQGQLAPQQFAPQGQPAFSPVPAPHTQQVPQQYAQPQQQYAQAPQGYAPQQGFVPGQPGQYVPQQAFAGQQAPMQPAFAPQPQYAGAQVPQQAQQVAQPVWSTPAPQNGAAPAADGKKKKKANVVDVDANGNPVQG